MEIIDARGYSCPKPVMMLMKKIKGTEQRECAILVDNETAKENVCRTAEARGWVVKSVNQEDIVYNIVLAK
jgi:tRNA 2-thiouridine synthesizing protein A